MKIKLYDTTLRDGAQGEGVAFSVEDKLAVTRKLDELGIDYVEGGWPGSNDRDAEFFARARNLHLTHARLAAFGSTCNPRHSVEDDPNIRALLLAETPVVTVFGKSWRLHVEKALGISLDENLAIIAATVAHLKRHGREVIYDAEHFFDGFAAGPEYALATLVAASRAGADCIVLCDTNGGTLTSQIRRAFFEVTRYVDVQLGAHTHNDSELAVANAIAAVQCGAQHVQGTINGYGERCGNANLCSIAPIIELKMGLETIGREKLADLTRMSVYVAELANLPHRADLPFVGRSAFAHKGGVHVSAVMRDPSTYEHIDPLTTGNKRRVLISDLSGKSNVLYKAAEMGIDLPAGDDTVRPLVQRIKELEHQGCEFEAAEGSFKLLLDEAIGRRGERIEMESYTVETHRDAAGSIRSEATVRVRFRGKMKEAAAVGSGPVHALDCALRLSVRNSIEQMNGIRLVDYKVRVLDGGRATASKVRVLVTTSDDEHTWSTVGVSDNILEASSRALIDAFNYKLSRVASTSLAEPTIQR